MRRNDRLTGSPKIISPRPPRPERRVVEPQKNKPPRFRGTKSGTGRIFGKGHGLQRIFGNCSVPSCLCGKKNSLNPSPAFARGGYGVAAFALRCTAGEGWWSLGESNPCPSHCERDAL